MFFKTLLTALLLLCISLPLASHAGTLYKWVDDEGRVHYSDQLPPVDAKRAHSAMDERGVTIDQVEPAKTPEQIKQEQEVERLRREREQLIEKQRTADRVLLRTFRTEDDIIMTRDGQLQAIDAYIKITHANIKRLKSSLEDLQRQAAARELSGKQIPEKFLQEIEDKNQALKDAYQSIVRREHDKDRIRKSFAKDLQRFRELKQLEQRNDPLQEATETLIEALMNVYDCGEDAHCDGPWQRARAYMKKYNTTPITMDAENILMSAAATEEKDISITLSRIQDSKQGNTLIFLDLQCKDSPQGANYCKSEAVQAIKAGFQPALGDTSGPQ
jgi:hypothetical protein